MAARVGKDRVTLSSEKDVARLDPGIFPVVDDFEIRLRDTERSGVHVDLASAGEGRLAGFPWWDHADADLREMSVQDVPLGRPDAPFHDMEQGFRILIWERHGQVLVLVSRDGSLSFEVRFAVPRERYLAAWARAIEEVRARGGAFKSLDAALREPGAVRALLLGNHGLTELPGEIGSFENLTYLDLHLNQLSSLPSEIGVLARLRWIDLRFNRIRALPEELARLASLESVNLAENQLGEIPAWVASMPRLTTFFVPGNPVHPASMERMRGMRPDVQLDYS